MDDAQTFEQRHNLLLCWARGRRIFVDPPLVSPQTRLEMRRGAERTGGFDPFNPDGTTVVYVGEEQIEERTGDFPSETMVARIALALDARMDEQKGE